MVFTEPLVQARPTMVGMLILLESPADSRFVHRFDIVIAIILLLMIEVVP
jgi:hypothetical protein